MHLTRASKLGHLQNQMRTWEEAECDCRSGSQVAQESSIGGKVFFMPLMRTLLGLVLRAQEVHVPDLVGQVEQDLKADGRALLWILGTSYKLCGLERVIGRLVPSLSHAHFFSFFSSRST